MLRERAGDLEAEGHSGPGELGHGAGVLEAVGKVGAAARVALSLDHARPDGGPPAGRLQVQHVDGRRNRRQPHLHAKACTEDYYLQLSQQSLRTGMQEPPCTHARVMSWAC